MVPSAGNVGVLWDPRYSAFVGDWAELRARAKIKNVTLHPVDAHLPTDLDNAFGVMVSERVDAVLTFSDVMTYNFPNRVAELAFTNRLPIITPIREITIGGGLMSYGPNIPDMFRRTAGYVDKILKGTSPADLPVQQPTKFELAINLKTAKALGLEVPPTLLARADEVIE
jgi:putative ABC transport system substrate-binding protein